MHVMFDLLVDSLTGAIASVLVASREQLGSVSSTFRTPLKGKESRLLYFLVMAFVQFLVVFIRPRRSICSASPSARLSIDQLM